MFAVADLEDKATHQLACYLRDWLNDAYSQVDPNADPPVRGIRNANTFVNVTDDFPLLQVYRTASSGGFLSRSEATIAYYLPSVSVLEKQPGIFRWVEVEIAKALQALRPGCSSADCCIPDILLMDLDTSLRSQHLYYATNNGIFPLLRIDFAFSEGYS